MEAASISKPGSITLSVSERRKDPPLVVDAHLGVPPPPLVGDAHLGVPSAPQPAPSARYHNLREQIEKLEMGAVWNCKPGSVSFSVKERISCVSSNSAVRPVKLAPDIEREARNGSGLEL